MLVSVGPCVCSVADVVGCLSRSRGAARRYHTEPSLVSVMLPYAFVCVIAEPAGKDTSRYGTEKIPLHCRI